MEKRRRLAMLCKARQGKARQSNAEIEGKRRREEGGASFGQQHPHVNTNYMVSQMSKGKKQEHTDTGRTTVDQ